MFDLLFSEFVKGVLLALRIDIYLVFVGILGNGNRDFRYDIFDGAFLELHLGE